MELREGERRRAESKNRDDKRKKKANIHRKKQVLCLSENIEDGGKSDGENNTWQE